MLQSFRPQGRCQHLDQGVVLAVAVVGQRPERTVSQRDQIGRCGVRDLAQVTDGRIEDTGYGSTAVIAAREDRVGERQKVPHQVQPLDRIAWGHRVDDGAALHVQIVDQDPSVLPVDKRGCPCDRRQLGARPSPRRPGSPRRQAPAGDDVWPRDHGTPDDDAARL